MTHYRIRLAREDEIEECQALCLAFFPDATQPAPESIWWVAVRGEDEIAAFASARILEEDGSLFMNSAGVLLEHRGQGLQKRLIRARCRWAKRHAPTKAVVTYTVTSNARSANSLIGCGFRQYVPAVPWFAGDDCVYWVKKL